MIAWEYVTILGGLHNIALLAFLSFPREKGHDSSPCREEKFSGGWVHYREKDACENRFFSCGRNVL